MRETAKIDTQHFDLRSKKVVSIILQYFPDSFIWKEIVDWSAQGQD